MYQHISRNLIVLIQAIIFTIIKPSNYYITCSDWEGLAIKIVDTTNENYDASWVQDLIKHTFYSWGGRSSIEVRLMIK